MRRLMATLVFLLAAASMATAAGREPTVYTFWAQSCPHSQRAMAFLEKAQREDPKLVVRTFEVENEEANAASLDRVLARIGLTGIALVPLTIVGDNVLIGFQDEALSGAEIKKFVAECRATGCEDKIADLLPGSRMVMAKKAPDCVETAKKRTFGQTLDMRRFASDFAR
jgi:thiol-disulfide isomerase/thioredoxin